MVYQHGGGAGVPVEPHFVHVGALVWRRVSRGGVGLVGAFGVLLWWQSQQLACGLVLGLPMAAVGAAMAVDMAVVDVPPGGT